jgi:hypothetical protein
MGRRYVTVQVNRTQQSDLKARALELTGLQPEDLNTDGKRHAMLARHGNGPDPLLRQSQSMLRKGGNDMRIPKDDENAKELFLRLLKHNELRKENRGLLMPRNYFCSYHDMMA